LAALCDQLFWCVDLQSVSNTLRRAIISRKTFIKEIDEIISIFLRSPMLLLCGMANKRAFDWAIYDIFIKHIAAALFFMPAKLFPFS